MVKRTGTQGCITRFMEACDPICYFLRYAPQSSRGRCRGLRRRLIVRCAHLLGGDPSGRQAAACPEMLGRAAYAVATRPRLLSGRPVVPPVKRPALPPVASPLPIKNLLGG